MKTLLLLHGAIGSATQLEQLKYKLEGDYNIHALNFPGHGGGELPAEFSIPLFAEYIKNYLDSNKLTQVSIFGYSMGGYVGMYLVKCYPTLVEKLITLATKFEWDETIAAKEVKMLQPDIIEQKVPVFAKALAEQHAPQDWKKIMLITQRMLTELGRENVLSLSDYAAIQTPVQLLLGDRDKMVTLEETVAVYKHLGNAQLGVLPQTTHPIEQVDADLLAFHVRRFLA